MDHILIVMLGGNSHPEKDLGNSPICVIPLSAQLITQAHIIWRILGNTVHIS